MWPKGCEFEINFVDLVNRGVGDMKVTEGDTRGISKLRGEKGGRRGGDFIEFAFAIHKVRQVLFRFVSMGWDARCRSGLSLMILHLTLLIVDGRVIYASSASLDWRRPPLLPLRLIFFFRQLYIIKDDFGNWATSFSVFVELFFSNKFDVF